MPVGRERVLSEDALGRLARELFAEVRAQHPKKPSGNLAEDVGGGVGVDLLEWLSTPATKLAMATAGAEHFTRLRA